MLTGPALAIVLAVGIPAGWYTISPLFERETVCEASAIVGAGAGSEKCKGVAVAAGGTTSIASATRTADTPSPAATVVATPAAAEPPQFQPRVLSQGEFHGADDFHYGRGQALLIETAPGQYTLRFENFSVRNGPDLFVYLSTDPGSNDGLLLGELKGTDGAFNYDVPAGTDIAQFKSAVVWCRQFAVLFATAPFA